MATKAITWVNEQGVFYTASSFGRCVKSLVASRLGYDQAPPPPSLQKIFTAGHDAEDLCVKVLTARGWQISDQQGDVLLPIDSSYGTIYLAGHLDGIYDASQVVLLPPEVLAGIAEIKSQGTASWDDYNSRGPSGPLWDTYAWQASIYMHARSLPLTWIRWHRDSTEENPIYDTHSLTEPPYSLADIRARIEEIEFHVAREDLPACDPYPSFGCPFFYLHDEDEEEREQPTVVKGLEALVRKYTTYRRDEMKLKEARDKVADEISRLLAEKGVIRAVEGDASVVMVERKSKTLDQKALKAAGIDLSAYQQERIFRFPRVTYGKERP